MLIYRNLIERNKKAIRTIIPGIFEVSDTFGNTAKLNGNIIFPIYIISGAILFNTAEKGSIALITSIVSLTIDLSKRYILIEKIAIFLGISLQ